MDMQWLIEQALASRLRLGAGAAKRRMKRLAGLFSVLLCCAALAGGCSSPGPLSGFSHDGDREMVALGEDDDDGNDACAESPAEAARRAETEANIKSIRQNTQLAKEICGEGNVLAVHLEGFECGPPVD